ncbi:MAG TPA: choice-of-anchor tandem repeat GloVer-containing protein [Candidatus Sulfotelmatobacter sp.]
MKKFRLAATLLFVAALSAVGLAQTVSEVFGFTGAAPAPGTVTPAQGRNGRLYGTTSGFGRTVTNGTVFSLSPIGKGGTIYTFNGTDGSHPQSSLTLATDGNYYGGATSGGTGNSGVLFRITASGIYSALYQFSGGLDGANPLAPPVQASDGNLYGATDGDSVTAGAFYKLVPSSGAVSTIFTLNPDGSQGSIVFAPLIQAADGSLYATAETGGANGCGTILNLSTSGQLLRLYSFMCGASGNFPAGPLVQASDGTIYGTTEAGGNVTSGECANGCGIVFRMSQGLLTVLHTFSGYPNDGAFPYAGLTLGTDGNLYGATGKGGVNDLGTLYQVTTGGQCKVLYSFVDKIGSGPNASLLQHTNGTFYGVAESGGQYGAGSVYSLNMGLGSFIALVRYTGRIGQPVQILGQGLTGSTDVTVNGVAATSFKVVSDTYMTAVIPTGATTGPVVVTTRTGTLTSNHNLRIVK